MDRTGHETGHPVALLGIRVVGMGVLTGMGEAAAVTVAVTVVAALTLLPALLGSFGLKVLSKRQRAQLAQGIVQDPAGTGRRHGMIGMRERAESAGGRFTANFGSDGTFVVHASLPLTAPGGSSSNNG